VVALTNLGIWLALGMGWLDPSDEDLKEDRKPRFLQDFAVVFIVVGMFLIYLILELFVF
jgi:hypothetical protein